MFDTRVPRRVLVFEDRSKARQNSVATGGVSFESGAGSGMRAVLSDSGDKFRVDRRVARWGRQRSGREWRVDSGSLSSVHLQSRGPRRKQTDTENLWTGTIKLCRTDDKEKRALWDFLGDVQGVLTGRSAVMPMAS